MWVSGWVGEWVGGWVGGGEWVGRWVGEWVSGKRTSILLYHRASCPGGRFPPSFIHQVIIITGLKN